MAVKFIALMVTSALLMCGCASLDLRTAYALSKLTPADLSPQDGRVAIIFPEGFVLRNPPQISYKASYQGAVKYDAYFQLIEDNTQAAFIPLPKDKRLEDISIFALSQTDLPKAIELQTHFQELETNGYDDWETSHNTNFDIEWIAPEIYDAYCDGKREMPVWVWVKTDKASPFRRLVNQKELDTFIGGAIKNSCATRSFTHPSQIP